MATNSCRSKDLLKTNRSFSPRNHISHPKQMAGNLRVLLPFPKSPACVQPLKLGFRWFLIWELSASTLQGRSICTHIFYHTRALQVALEAAGRCIFFRSSGVDASLGQAEFSKLRRAVDSGKLQVAGASEAVRFLFGASMASDQAKEVITLQQKCNFLGPKKYPPKAEDPIWGVLSSSVDAFPGGWCPSKTDDGRFSQISSEQFLVVGFLCATKRRSLS